MTNQLELRDAAIKRLIKAMEHGECALAVMKAARQAHYEANVYLDKVERETDQRLFIQSHEKLKTESQV